jgi:GNAT superfamily N-acetyltransferase
MTQGPPATAPQPLRPDHDIAAFRNGRHDSLDEWLKRRAFASEGLSARTYVICDAARLRRVVGYYAISTAVERRVALPSARLRRGMPDQIPLMLIGRLALDQAWQGKGLGSALLSDALKRCFRASAIVGARAVVAHAIDDVAADFYLRHGFIRSVIGHRVMLMPIESLAAVYAV